jgi:hypothetical protein
MKTNQKTMTVLLAAGIAALSASLPSHTLAQGLSVSVGGVSVSTGSGTSTTGAASSTTTSILKPVPGSASEQETALAAVKSDRALSLDKILAAARRYTDGDIIDAQLITARGFLLYDLKVLDTKGNVGDLYFYALSGKLVETN